MFKRSAQCSILSFAFLGLPIANSCVEGVRADEIAIKDLEPTRDSLETVRKNIESGKGIIVDVRSMEETKKGHLQDALLLPLQDLSDAASEKKVRKAIPDGKIVYLYCVVGKRALAGGKSLQAYGYDARPLKQGFQELIEAGFEKSK